MSDGEKRGAIVIKLLSIGCFGIAGMGIISLVIWGKTRLGYVEANFLLGMCLLLFGLLLGFLALLLSCNYVAGDSQNEFALQGEARERREEAIGNFFAREQSL